MTLRVHRCHHQKIINSRWSDALRQYLLILWFCLLDTVCPFIHKGQLQGPALSCTVPNLSENRHDTESIKIVLILDSGGYRYLGAKKQCRQKGFLCILCFQWVISAGIVEINVLLIVYHSFQICVWVCACARTTFPCFLILFQLSIWPEKQ